MKKLTGIAVVAILALAVYGCGGSEPEYSTGSAGREESRKGSAANVSEEAFIDVLAHQQILAAKYMKEATNPIQMERAVEKIDSEMNKLLAKHNVTIDDINAYAERYEEDPGAYMATMQKLSARMDELSEEYGVK